MKKALSIIYAVIARPLAKTAFGRWYPVKMLGYAVARLARKPYIEIKGQRLHLDPADSNRLSIRGDYEPFETELVERLLGPGEIAIDLGANVGYYTLLMARAVGEMGKVYAFEPDPGNYALLRENVQWNGHQNVVTEKLAVSNMSGPAQLHKEAFNDATPSLWRSDHCRSSVEVQCARLDDYFESHADDGVRIRLIKMDIEGAEALAIEGMTRLLEDNPAVVILTEYLPNVMRSLGTEPRDFLERLQSLGFALYDIDEAEHRLTPLDTEVFMAKYAMTWSNIVCTKDPQIIEGVLLR